MVVVLLPAAGVLAAAAGDAQARVDRLGVALPSAIETLGRGAERMAQAGEGADRVREIEMRKFGGYESAARARYDRFGCPQHPASEPCPQMRQDIERAKQLDAERRAILDDAARQWARHNCHVASGERPQACATLEILFERYGATPPPPDAKPR